MNRSMNKRYSKKNVKGSKPVKNNRSRRNMKKKKVNFKKSSVNRRYKKNSRRSNKKNRKQRGGFTTSSAQTVTSQASVVTTQAPVVTTQAPAQTIGSQANCNLANNSNVFQSTFEQPLEANSTNVDNYMLVNNDIYVS